MSKNTTIWIDMLDGPSGKRQDENMNSNKGEVVPVLN
jgi:hypothetical protein